MSHSAERIGTQPCPGFPMGTRDPNSSSYTCAAGNLLTESSPQPQCSFFFLRFILFLIVHVNVLCARMSVHRLHTILTEARGGHWISWNWIYKWF